MKHFLPSVAFGLLVYMSPSLCADTMLFIPNGDDALFTHEASINVNVDGLDFELELESTDLRTSDTVVRRRNTARFTTTPDVETIQVELVALSLRSVTPVDIPSRGGLFDVYVNLDETAASTGQLILQRLNENSGVTVDAFLNLHLDVKYFSLPDHNLSFSEKVDLELFFPRSDLDQEWQWESLRERLDYVLHLKGSSFHWSTQPVPEPSSSLLLLSLAGMVLVRRRKLRHYS